MKYRVIEKCKLGQKYFYLERYSVYRGLDLRKKGHWDRVEDNWGILITFPSASAAEAYVRHRSLPENYTKIVKEIEIDG